jgi:hypothetical protein
MSRLVTLQLLGPLTVFIAALAAEAAAYALAADPASEVLWYINLSLLGSFLKGHYILSQFITVPGSQLILIAIPILALAGYGFFANRKLSLAIASNLSLVYACFLLLSWSQIGRPIMQASLLQISIPSDAGRYMLFILLATSLVSFSVSHLVYLYAIRTKA